MSASLTTQQTIRTLSQEGYKYGFVTDIEADTAPPGLSEDTVRFISAKKDEPEWLLEWRLAVVPALAGNDRAGLGQAQHRSDRLSGAQLLLGAEAEGRTEIAGRGRSRAAAHLRKARHPAARARGPGRASRSTPCSTASRSRPRSRRSSAELGIIFCSFGEAVREHPELVRKYLGTVVPQNDNFFAALNSAVFSDGSFAYIPAGVRCPMELSTYFRINARNSGQFERTLLIADQGAYVSYLEGCTAPQRDENQLHAAVVELIAHEDAQIKYSTVQNWYPGDAEGKGGIYNFVTKRGACRGARSKSPGPRSRPARRSPGNTRAAFWKATIWSANSIRSRSPTTASRPIPAPR